MDSITSNVLTRAEACAFIGCSRTTLYRMEQNGILEGMYYNIGRIRYYYTASLEAWKKSGGQRYLHIRK